MDFLNLSYFFQKLQSFDDEFEYLVATCLALPPLNIKKKFLRHYAEFYIDLEKIYGCLTETNVYACVYKVSRILPNR
jgi:hypothetical protein